MNLAHFKGLASGVLFLFLSISLAQQASREKVAESDFTSAETCGQCHQEIHSQWSQSMHSRSITDPLYRSVIERLPDDAKKHVPFCLSCHAPVAGASGTLFRISDIPDWERDLSPLAREGVTCDFCHTISGEELTEKILPGAYVYPHARQTEIKFGPEADSETKAHPTRVSSFLSSAEFCSTCHRFKHPATGEELQNTFEEWRQSSYSKQGTACQDCHMPKYTGARAEGGREGARISAHLFPGGHTEMVRKAASLAVFGTREMERNEPSAKVVAIVKNMGAGHAIPTGVPGVREIVLEVQVWDSASRMLGQDQTSFALNLEDSQGRPVFPWETYTAVQNNTIASGASKQKEFVISIGEGSSGPLRVEAKLWMHPLSRSMARRLNFSPPEPILMASAEAEIR